MEEKQTDTAESAELAEHQLRMQPVPLRNERLTARGHLRTVGERKFDRWTYNYVGYIANALLSVASVYAVERTSQGQAFMRGLVRQVNRLTNADPQKAEMLATKSFFLAGGFFVLLPMKLMENAKNRLVSTWNREAYGDKVDTDPVLIQSQREMEAQPKQTWSSIISGRVLALIPFYFTVGALWDNKSRLSRLTNPSLSALGKEGMASMEAHDPKGFAALASKGVYFDRPIAAASRLIGKATATLFGHKDALAHIGQMERDYPGMIKCNTKGGHAHDTAHVALPYYFISEAITSGVVAWGVYHLTRMTGYVLGKKQDAPLAAEAPLPETILQPIDKNSKKSVPVQKEGLMHLGLMAPSLARQREA